MGQYPFPIFNMPKVFFDDVAKEHQHTRMDPAAIVTTKLVAFSVAASTLFEVEIEPRFVVPLALYAQITAPSGFGKSILDKYVQEPFKEYERESAARKAENQKQFEGELLLWEEKKKTLLSMYRKEMKIGESVTQLEQDIKQHEANKPLACETNRLLLSDATPGAIKKFFAGAGKVGGIILSEGSVAFKDRRMFSEPGLLCNLYDGTTFSVDRAIGDSISIIDPAAGILVFTQNQTFQKFCSKHGNEMHDNGIFQRMLLYFEEQNNSVGYILPNVHDTSGLGELQNLIRTMLAEYAKLVNKPSGKKRRLSVSPEAAQLYQEIKNQLKVDTQPMRPLENFKGFAAKYTNNMMRIAGLFHLMEGREDDIKRDSVEQANCLCYWYLQQAMMYFDEGRQLEVKAYQLYNWFNDELTKRNVPYLEKTKLYQYTPSRLRGRGKADVQPLLDILIEKQLLVIEKLLGIGTIVKKPHLDFGF